MKTRVEISAGGVVYRDAAEGPEVCLIQTQGGKAWQLPKGIIERGEETLEAAIREVSEETGLSSELRQELDKIEYWYVWNADAGPERVHKWVYFYLLRYLSGETKDHDDEVDDACWVPIADAHGLLSFESEQHVMRQADEVLASEA
jgi:8-oxo-dGTP diphosphatase